MVEPLLEPIFRVIRANETEGYIKPDSVVCDVGCGKSATFLKKIKNKIKKGAGADKEVKNEIIENLEFRNLNLNDKLPLEDEEFDHITILAVIEHLGNSEMILSESYRALKRGGSIIMTFPSRKSKRLLEFLADIKLLSKEMIDGHRNYFSVDEIKEMLLSAGFKRAETKKFELGYNNIIVAYK